jgi:ATPases involved in chromosome partitioning
MNPKMLAIDIANFLNVSVQYIHKQLKTKNLLFNKNQNRVYFKYDTSRRLLNLNVPPKVISMQIVKGGTGKTSLTHSIAIRANLYGMKVLCIDLDQQGNLTQSFKVNPEKTPVMVDIISNNFPIEGSIVTLVEGLDLLPSRIENAVLDSVLMLKRLPLDRVYKEKIDHLKSTKKYNLILIDCPPALGQSVAAASLSSDYIIAPVTPEKFSLSGLKVTNQEIENIEKAYQKNLPLKIILNKFDSRTTLSHETLSSLIKHDVFSSKLFKTYIRISQEFPNVIAQGISIFDSTKNNSAKEDIDLLTREVLGIEKATNEQKVALGSLEQHKIESLA